MPGVALHVRFIAGRYHATAWGHHVNEGAIDWPPSPHRLLRALYAQSFRLPAPCDTALRASLMRKLAAPPAYHVPNYTGGHTRHYMPGKKPERVIDAFVAVAPADRLVVQWGDAELSADEHGLLRELTRGLTYLGRAESWCEAVVGEPVQGAVGPGQGDGEPIALLAIDPEADVEAVLEEDTAAMRKKGADAPAGTRWERYFVAPPRSGAGRRARSQTAPVALVIQVEDRVPPRNLDAVEVANAFRRAALSRLGDGADDPALTGRDRGGSPAQGHEHAHFVPFDLEGGGRLRHVLVWAPMGLTPPAVRAFESLREVTLPRRRDALQVGLVQAGPLQDLDHLPVTGASRVWTSATPFLLNRHPKVRGGRQIDGPEDQLRRELELRGLPAPISVQPVEQCVLQRSRPVRWLEFRRWRGRHQPAIPTGYGFRLQFDELVQGPICLGFGSHFGLGSFVRSR